MRQHGPLGSGTAIWTCLTASNHENHEIPSCDKTCPSAGLRAQHFNEHALHTEPCLISKECYSCPSSRSDSRILSSSCLKAALATHNLDTKGLAYVHVRIITLRAWASLRKQESSASHCQVSIARQRSEFASETSIGPCLRSSKHEIP